ncbi:hypothetical protein RIF29_08588 [Crotalaria pallida]|uniref:Uncharacterized protein n=1 Tax=Crotalaria pallida TaxID=3830 RepID=A0AAN9FXG7_CROPI
MSKNVSPVHDDGNREIPPADANGGASQPPTVTVMETIDENRDNAKNQGTNPKIGKEEIRKDNILSENHFGPWMMVKRPNRRKDSTRNKISMNVATASLAYESTKSVEPNMMKSRFAALDTDNEEMNSSNDKATNGAREITNEDYNNNLSKTGLNSKGKHVAQKLERVRNSLGGKNPQQKGTKPNVWQPNNKKISFSNLIVDKNSTGVERVTVKRNNEINTEASNSDMSKASRGDTKAQDEENRRRMKIFQQTHNYKGDALMTQVILPAAEVIEAVEQRKKSNNLVPSRNEPPDRGSPKNMADCEETCITMEMDSSDKVEPNGSGIIVPSLQGPPLPNSQ